MNIHFFTRLFRHFKRKLKYKIKTHLIEVEVTFPQVSNKHKSVSAKRDRAKY